MRQLVTKVVNQHDKARPFMHAKLDIMDGFWRLAVNKMSVWNFCYVLPHKEKIADLTLDDVEITVPHSFHTGW